MATLQSPKVVNTYSLVTEKHLWGGGEGISYKKMMPVTSLRPVSAAYFCSILTLAFTSCIV